MNAVELLIVLFWLASAMVLLGGAGIVVWILGVAYVLLRRRK